MNAPRIKAYSYLRFSTPEQQQGDSFRRQASMAQEYALRHDLDLDAELTFQDLGVSAYRGSNAEAGRLADFLEAVRLGQVKPGSVLLVEALDRLSRLVPRKALRVLEDIVQEGVKVVTLNDGREYTPEILDSDPMSLLTAIIVFMRANEESASKARRLKAAWEGKRLRAGETPLTGVVPAWITLNRETKKLELIPDRAAVVKGVFADYLAGSGHHAIAERLNREGVRCFGSAVHWHRTYIKKILNNVAVYGTYVPHRYAYVGAKRSREPLEPIQGYYPAAVERSIFDQAQALGNRGGALKQRTGVLANLLGGLAKCPHCGSTMTRVNKGSAAKGGKPKLVCTRAKAGAGCQYHAVDIALVEQKLVASAEQIVSSAPSGNAQLDADLERAETSIEALRNGIANLLESLEKHPSGVLAERVQQLESALATEEEHERRLFQQLAVSSSQVLEHRLKVLEAALLSEPLDRQLANAALRSVIESVVVDYPNGLLTFRWKQGGESSVTYAWPRSERLELAVPCE